MGVISKRKEVLEGNSIGRLSVINLFVSLGISLSVTVWALFIDSFVHSVALTGIISAGLTVFSIISFFLFIPLIERSDKGKLFFMSLFLLAVSYLLISLSKNLWVFLIFAVFLVGVQTVRLSTFGIIIKDKSLKGETSSNEGMIYTFLNIGYVIGPLIAGYVLASHGINKVFFLASIFIFFSLVVLKVFKVVDHSKLRKPHTDILKNFISFFKDKNRVRAYILGGGATTWWVLIYLFMPLFIINSGFSNSLVGYFLFAIAIPLILFEYKFSSMVGKYGFKRIFSIGFLIGGVLTAVCFFFTNPLIIFSLLVLSAVGMAMLEPTTEAYFLETVSSRDASRFFGPYNTTRDLNQMTAKIIPSLLVLFLPFKAVFLFFGALLLLMFFITLSIKDDRGVE